MRGDAHVYGHMSYLIFLSREVRALTTALNASSLPGATHLSGCNSTANFLYALLTSSLCATNKNKPLRQTYQTGLQTADTAKHCSTWRGITVKNQIMLTGLTRGPWLVGRNDTSWDWFVTALGKSQRARLGR